MIITVPHVFGEWWPPINIVRGGRYRSCTVRLRRASSRMSESPWKKAFTGSEWVSHKIIIANHSSPVYGEESKDVLYPFLGLFLLIRFLRYVEKISLLCCSRYHFPRIVRIRRTCYEWNGNRGLCVCQIGENNIFIRRRPFSVPRRLPPVIFQVHSALPHLIAFTELHVRWKCVVPPPGKDGAGRGWGEGHSLRLVNANQRTYIMETGQDPRKTAKPRRSHFTCSPQKWIMMDDVSLHVRLAFRLAAPSDPARCVRFAAARLLPPGNFPSERGPARASKSANFPRP